MAGDQPYMNGNRTFFQQKWDAKSRSRAYHGDHIPEKKWVRLFSRHLQSVVDMPPSYLGANDGSEQAAGRGSGLTTNQVTAEKFWTQPSASSKTRFTHNRARTSPPKNALLAKPLAGITPYMQMTFAPLERRLDTAVFRALFASSVRQARQFVIHGAVKVNGKKMVHPSYQLNPGDMFQVDIEKVLYGTGEQKVPGLQEKVMNKIEAARKKEALAEKKLREAGKQTEATEGENGTAASEEAATEAKAEGEAEAEAEVIAEEGTPLTEEQEWNLKSQTLQAMLVRVKMLLRDKKKTGELSAKDKAKLRVFRSSAKRFLAHPDDSELDPNELMNELRLQMKGLDIQGKSFESQGGADGAEAAAEGDAETKEAKPTHNRKKMIDKALEMEGLNEEQKKKAIEVIGYEDMTRDEMRSLAQLLRREAENPVDESKPYATPWRPRPFMSAFAFIPRYLEVNPNICAAVYLRHPVARKGLAEVPTPFPYFTNQLAHNWYLGRG